MSQCLYEYTTDSLREGTFTIYFATNCAYSFHLSIAEATQEENFELGPPSLCPLGEGQSGVESLGVEIYGSTRAEA